MLFRSFAFIGFDEVVTLSDETRNPSRVIPRALLLALGISTLLYVAVGIAAISVIDYRVLADSERPLALVIEHDGARSATSLLAWMALASTASTVLLLVSASARLLFDMGRDGALPRVLARVSGRTRAPAVATWVAFVIAAGFAWSGPLDFVAAVTDFTVYAVSIVVNLAVLQLRRSMPAAPRTMRAGPDIKGWPVAPILGLGMTFLMLAFLATSAWVVGGGLVIAAVAAWGLQTLMPQGAR